MSLRVGNKPPPSQLQRAQENQEIQGPAAPVPAVPPVDGVATDTPETVRAPAANATVAAARRSAAAQEAVLRQGVEQQLRQRQSAEVQGTAPPNSTAANAPTSSAPASSTAANAPGNTAGVDAPVGSTAGAPPTSLEAARQASAERATAIHAEYEADPDHPPQGLRTYMRGEENRVRMSWPARAGGDHGVVPSPPTSTRCNIFSANVAYEAGLSVPTREVETRRGIIHGPLAPAELAAPFASERARDPHGVRDRMERITDPAQAQPGDWVLYRDRETGNWRHVDVVEANRGTDSEGRQVLATMGAGGDEGREIHGAENHVGADGSLAYRQGRVRRTNFDEVMILRPTHMRPLDPATGRPVDAPNALPTTD